MSDPRRVLVVTDASAPGPEILHAIQQRALEDDVRFRLVVLNPARAEIHLLHPERHDRADEAELSLLLALPDLESAAGGHVMGWVSVRHDPMDAIEEALHAAPVDEILLHVREHGLARRLHQDLPHRLAHHAIPVVTVAHHAVP